MTKSTNVSKINLEMIENIFFIKVEEKKKIKHFAEEKKVLVCLEVSHVRSEIFNWGYYNQLGIFFC